MIPNIFISSTVKDLHYLRDAVRDIVNQLGYNPVMSEYGEIGYLPSMTAEDSCYYRIKECQLVILIIGKRYSSPSLNGQSVTENEYESTVQNKKPIITIVDEEVLTGDVAGAAEADGTGTASTVPNILVQNSDQDMTYVKGKDYDISTSLKDDHIGRIFFYADGDITDGQSLKVQYAYAASTYYTIDAFAETEVEGRLRFVSDNPAGIDLELEVWRVSVSPDGDTSLIGDDWSTLQFTGEILKDEINHPDNPYMQIIIS